MSVKDQKIDKNPLSIKLSQIASLISLAEEIHEEYNEIPTTDFESLYTSSGIEGTKRGKGKEDYFSLYDYFAKLYSKFIIESMLDKAKITQESEIEYINILLDDGTYLVLEGEEDKVVIPHPYGLASTHTHPNVCLFSHKDLETADQLFIKDYLAVGVLTTRCLLLLYRRGVYIIEDREELLKLAKAISKSKKADDVVRAYNSVKFTYLILQMVQFA